MKVKFVLTGKSNKDFVKPFITDYSKRINRHLKFETIEIPKAGIQGNSAFSKIKNAEGKLLLKKIEPPDFLILLDEKGKSLDSIEFSKLIEHHRIISTKCLAFAVGGAYGFSEEIYSRANQKIRLSKMTMSHQIVRIVFMDIKLPLGNDMERWNCLF